MKANKTAQTILDNLLTENKDRILVALADDFAKTVTYHRRGLLTGTELLEELHKLADLHRSITR